VIDINARTRYIVWAFFLPLKLQGFSLVPTRRRGNAVSTRLQSGATGRWRVPNRFPRAGVGMQSRRDCKAAQRDAGASRIGSHAGAWEPEKRPHSPIRLYR